jgi:hypothetical protein
MNWIIYLLLGVHAVAALWATNFLDFFVHEPKTVRVKRLLGVWFLPVVGLIPIIKMRKFLVEESQKRKDKEVK